MGGGGDDGDGDDGDGDDGDGGAGNDDGDDGGTFWFCCLFESKETPMLFGCE